MMERLQGNLVRPSYQPVEYRPYISTTELNEMSNSPSTTQESQVQFINSGPQPPGPGPYWRTGVLRRFPWTGIGSLVVALVAMLAAVVVLIRSDGQALDSWRVQPSVILSIASALFRTALVYALAQGAIVFWYGIQPFNLVMSLLSIGGIVLSEDRLSRTYTKSLDRLRVSKMRLFRGGM